MYLGVQMESNCKHLHHVCVCKKNPGQNLEHHTLAINNDRHSVTDHTITETTTRSRVTFRLSWGKNLLDRKCIKAHYRPALSDI